MSRMKRSVKKEIAAFALVLAAVALQGRNAFAADVEINATNFPDEVFRSYVGDHFDSDKDGKLSEEEINAVREIDCSGTEKEPVGIASLQGVEFFDNLWRLDCDYNALSSLDLSTNTKVEYIECSDNQLTSIDVSGCKNLYSLILYRNKLREIDLSHNTELCYFGCYVNQLETLLILLK